MEYFGQTNLFSTDTNENTKDKENPKSQQNNIKNAKIKDAIRLLELLNSVFDIYIKRQLKSLEIIPMMSSKKIDINELEKLNFDENYKKRIQRKLIILQKVYIEGNSKKVLGEDYVESKTFINDKGALIDDLAVLLYGAEGMNYRILEKDGLNLEK